MAPSMAPPQTRTNPQDRAAPGGLPVAGEVGAAPDLDEQRLIARRRLERGVRLNHPEAIALITDYVIEGGQYATVLGYGYAPPEEYKKSYRGMVTMWKFDRSKGRIDALSGLTAKAAQTLRDDLLAFVNQHLADLIDSDKERLREVDSKIRAITDSNRQYLAHADVSRVRCRVGRFGGYFARRFCRRCCGRGTRAIFRLDAELAQDPFQPGHVEGRVGQLLDHHVDRLQLLGVDERRVVDPPRRQLAREVSEQLLRATHPAREPLADPL